MPTLLREGRIAPPFASTKASLTEQSRRITTLPVPVQRSSNNSLVILKVGLKQMDNSSGISIKLESEEHNMALPHLLFHVWSRWWFDIKVYSPDCSRSWLEAVRQQWGSHHCLLVVSGSPNSAECPSTWRPYVATCLFGPINLMLLPAQALLWLLFFFLFQIILCSEKKTTF